MFKKRHKYCVDIISDNIGLLTNKVTNTFDCIDKANLAMMESYAEIVLSNEGLVRDYKHVIEEYKAEVNFHDGTHMKIEVREL